MFQDLPETNPQKDTKKPRAIVAAALLQVVIVSALIIIQMAMPAKLGGLHSLTTLYMAPPPPPPPPAPPAGPAPKAREARRNEGASERTVVVQEAPRPAPTVEQPELVAPTQIPTELARIMEIGPVGGGGVIGGVPGGIPGGVLGGVMGGIADAPPPPAPKAPVRVGGDVRQPKIVRMVEPKYPAAAKTARVEGSVIIEATLTEQGTIDKIKVISGPPLLVQ